MITLFQRIVGRISTLFDRIYYKFIRPVNIGEEFDKTGLVEVEGRAVKVYADDMVVWADYDSIAFSFWRAQELTLFKNHLGEPARPIVDIGCGDGSFASVLFKEVDYGIDHDPEALSAASRRGIYKNLLEDTKKIESGTIRTVYSNCVLEHVKDIESLLFEVARITAPGGVFAFSVPVARHKKDLRKYFGTWYSEFVTDRSVHHNLLEPAAWEGLIKPLGFQTVLVKYYNPDWAIYRYEMLRFLSDRALGLVIPKIGRRIFNRYMRNFLDMVRRAVTETKDGGGIFILAVKK